MDNCDYIDDSRVRLPIDNDDHPIGSSLLIHSTTIDAADSASDAVSAPRFTTIEYRDDMDTPLLFDVSNYLVGDEEAGGGERVNTCSIAIWHNKNDQLVTWFQVNKYGNSIQKTCYIRSIFHLINSNTYIF